MYFELFVMSFSSKNDIARLSIDENISVGLEPSLPIGIHALQNIAGRESRNKSMSLQQINQYEGAVLGLPFSGMEQTTTVPRHSLVSKGSRCIRHCN